MHDVRMDGIPTLGDWMNARRAELEAQAGRRIGWGEFADTIGISRNALLDLRRGVYSPAPATRPHIERAFQWTPKSIDRIQVGEEPTRLEDQAAAQQEIRKASLDDLAERFAELAKQHSDQELLAIMGRVMEIRSTGRDDRGHVAG